MHWNHHNNIWLCCWYQVLTLSSKYFRWACLANKLTFRESTRSLHYFQNAHARAHKSHFTAACCSNVHWGDIRASSNAPPSLDWPVDSTNPSRYSPSRNHNELRPQSIISPWNYVDAMEPTTISEVIGIVSAPGAQDWSINTHWHKNGDTASEKLHSRHWTYF